LSTPSIIERKERFARKMAGKARPTVRSHDRLLPGQHLTAGFPVLDLGIQPEISLGDWRLDVGGLVENPKSFTWAEFNSLPQFEDVSDFHCVTTWSKFDVRWGGVAFFTLAEIVRPKREAKHVLFGSYDNYTTNVRMEDVMDDDVLIASKYDGQPLSREHGGPVRIVIPKLYGWKSAKFVRSIEFSAEDKPGFWEVRGYSNTADPWTDDRFSGGQPPATFDTAPGE
jgi:DMSO/TMAO reductase YedYZ molybdopterin-dependent catalytic subunit